MDVDPRACIGSFFDRIQVADAEYKKHFDLEVQAFITRITKRAAEKVEEALAEEEVSNYFHHFGLFLIPIWNHQSLYYTYKLSHRKRNVKSA